MARISVLFSSSPRVGRPCLSLAVGLIEQEKLLRWWRWRLGWSEPPGYMIHRLEFQMLAHTEVELFPKGKMVIKTPGEEDFSDKGLLLILIISSLSF